MKEIKQQNIENKTYNESIYFDRCNLTNCVFNKKCTFDKCNLVDCTLLVECELIKSNNISLANFEQDTEIESEQEINELENETEEKPKNVKE